MSTHTPSLEHLSSEDTKFIALACNNHQKMLDLLNNFVNEQICTCREQDNRGFGDKCNHCKARKLIAEVEGAK